MQPLYHNPSSFHKINCCDTKVSIVEETLKYKVMCGGSNLFAYRRRIHQANVWDGLSPQDPG